MSVKKLLIFATEMEAKETLKELKCQATSEKGLYTYQEGHLLICGIGLLPACHATTRYHSLADQIINFGIVGSLQRDYSIGHCFSISQVSKYLPFVTNDSYSQQFAKSVFPTIELEGEKRLISTDHPIHDEKIKQELGQIADVVDMEGYGIAFAAKKVNKPCRLYKVVSDFCSEKGPELIKQQIGHCSKLLANLVDQNTV